MSATWTRVGEVDGEPGHARVLVDPPSSRIDEHVALRVTGVAPGARVTLRVSVLDGAQREWESRSTFVADAGGRVDVSTQAPVDGGYSGVDATGPLWSMMPAGDGRPVFFSRRRPTPLQMTVVAEIDGEDVAHRPFVRTFCDPDVVGAPVADSGIVGTLFATSRGGAPAPGVLLLSGSDGGQHDHAAALLASHGYAVLALTCFGAEDTPQHLNHIELDDIGRALEWLASQPQVDASRIATLGLSRGGELALQVGSMFGRVGAVVAGAPSSVRQAGLTGSHTDFTQPAWVHGGVALPFVPGRFGPLQFLRFMATWLLRRPMRQRAMFERLLRGGTDVERAEIEVERIAGPVLLISGSDDQLWPSDRYAEAVMRRLDLRAHRYPRRHTCYPGAGHFVCCPYALPSLPPLTRLSPVGGLTIDFGGTAAANAAAATASWQEILDFLDRFRAGRQESG